MSLIGSKIVLVGNMHDHNVQVIFYHETIIISELTWEAQAVVRLYVCAVQLTK
jgi:hypothetical protein